MQVWKDPYFTLEVDAQRQLVRVRRSAASFADLNILRASFDTLNVQMASLPRAEYSELQDLREARGRNDKEFEDIMTRERKRLSEGFRRVAILVATQVGRLQVQRHVGEDESETTRVFLLESEAVRWLTEK